MNTNFEEQRDPIPHFVVEEVYYTCPKCGGMLSFEDEVGKLACADCDYGWRKDEKN